MLLWCFKAQKEKKQENRIEIMIQREEVTTFDHYEISDMGSEEQKALKKHVVQNDHSVRRDRKSSGLQQANLTKCHSSGQVNNGITQAEQENVIACVKQTRSNVIFKVSLNSSSSLK